MALADILARHGVDASSLFTPKYQRDTLHPVFVLHVPTHLALKHWELLRHLVSETAYWPVIGWDRFTQPPWEEEPVQEIIQRGIDVDIDTWFEAMIQRTEAQQISQVQAKPLGGLPRHRIHLHRFPFTPPSLAPIALIPTEVPWKVPAFLRITGDEVQPPHIHVAVMKYWYEQWEADLVGAVPGEMELHVYNRPTTYAASLELARKQNAYCPDLIDQDVGSIPALTEMLLLSNLWRFWWD